MTAKSLAIGAMIVRWVGHVWRWWYAVVLVLLAVGAVGAVLWMRRDAAGMADSSQVMTVERGNLSASIAPTGEVYAPRAAEMSFDVTKIALVELYVSPGQKVKAGAALARIDPTTLERAVSQAEADLTVAQDDLEGAKNPYSDLDLIQAGLAVNQAEMALVDAKENLEKARDPYTELDLIKARLVVTQSLVALDNAQTGLDDVLHPDIEAAQIVVRDAAAALATARNDLTIAQNDSENAAKLRTLEYEALYYRNVYWEAQKKFEEKKIDQQKLDWEYSNMLAAEEKLNQARARAESNLASAQNKVATAQEAYQEALDELAKMRKGPDATELAQAQSQVTQAEYNLAEAREEVARIEGGPEPQDVTKAQYAVAQAEYGLAKVHADAAKIEAGPDPREIELAQAKVLTAQAALGEAQATLKAADMAAPFDATVISVGAQVGDLVSSGTTIVNLADLSNLRVRAMVDETEISQVEIGQDVAITFDAFPGQQFSGKVLEVPLQGQLTQNVLMYEVPVSLEGTADVSLKSGMTANLSITVGRGQNVLLVPATAVQRGDQGNFVRLQDAGSSEPVYAKVDLGLSDGIYVEVKRGLNEGDRIVIEYSMSEQQLGASQVRMPAGGFAPLGGMRGR